MELRCPKGRKKKKERKKKPLIAMTGPKASLGSNNGLLILG
jgi:hypothetical protein